MKQSKYIFEAIGFAAVLLVIVFAASEFKELWTFPDPQTHLTTDIEEVHALGKQAESGDVEAMVQLTDLYYFGESGLDVDRCAALYWFDKAARQGNALSQERLSEAYFYGDGVEDNDLLSYYWAKASANNGHASRLLNTLIKIGEKKLTPHQLEGSKTFAPMEQPPIEINSEPVYRMSLLSSSSIISCCGG